MKTSTAIFIALLLITVAGAAFLIGRRHPQQDGLQKELAGLRSLAVDQEQTIERMDSTIQSYDVAIREFVTSFDQFKIDNNLQLERMERHAARGREFQSTQIKKLADLNKRRDDLAEEAKRFQY
jgi:hypothetical protein